LAGATRLTNAVGGDSKATRRIQERAQSYLDYDPDIANVEVVKIPDGGVFDILNNRIGLSSSNPDIMAHEAEHARTLRSGGGLYGALLNLSKKTTALSNIAALPVVLGMHAFVDDDNKRKNILKALAGFTALAALPNILEEGRASARAIVGSPATLDSVGTLLPAFGEHALEGAIAPALLLAGMKL